MAHPLLVYKNNRQAAQAEKNEWQAQAGCIGAQLVIDRPGLLF
jgi:hypothetical protein